MGVALVERRLLDALSVDGAGERPSEPGAAVPRLSPSTRTADSRARVLDGALRCVERFGVSKTTVDDIARAARLSRATLYRLFPGGRDEVIRGMVEGEVAGFFSRLAFELDDADSLEERLVRAMVSTADAIVSHAALGRVMSQEPEVLLPHIAFGELDQVLSVASSFLAPYLCDVLQPEDARRVGEWTTRLVLSHVVCPHSALDDAWDEPRGSSPGAVSPFAIHPGGLPERRARWIVRQFVLPGIATLSAPGWAPPRAAGAATAPRPINYIA